MKWLSNRLRTDGRKDFVTHYKLTATACVVDGHWHREVFQRGLDTFTEEEEEQQEKEEERSVTGY